MESRFMCPPHVDDAARRVNGHGVENEQKNPQIDIEDLTGRTPGRAELAAMLGYAVVKLRKPGIDARTKQLPKKDQKELGKRPVENGWPDKLYTPEQARALGNRYGIACAASDIAVLDFDTHDGLPTESKKLALAKAVAAHAGLADHQPILDAINAAVVTKTPTGGEHAMFRQDGARLTSVNGLLSNVDLKAGYVGDDGKATESSGQVLGPGTDVTAGIYVGTLPARDALPTMRPEFLAYLKHRLSTPKVKGKSKGKAGVASAPMPTGEVDPAFAAKLAKREGAWVEDKWKAVAHDIILAEKVRAQRGDAKVNFLLKALTDDLSALAHTKTGRDTAIFGLARRFAQLTAGGWLNGDMAVAALGEAVRACGKSGD